MAQGGLQRMDTILLLSTAFLAQNFPPALIAPAAQI